jgi:hypothetical protein
MVVDLLTANNSPVARTYANRDGVARLCDFGEGEYKIRVGDRSCNAVEIQGVHNRYPEVADYTATVSTCKGEGDGFNTCRVYFRVASDTGEPLPGVSIKKSSTGSTAPLTDAYGRSYALLRGDQDDAFTFSKNGYREQRVAASCGDHRQAERAVVMKRSTP